MTVLPGQLPLPLPIPSQEEQRDAGMAAAERAQAKSDPIWAELAYAAIERVALRQPFVHVDDVMAEGVPAPAHFNAWGAVWTKAIRGSKKDNLMPILERVSAGRPAKEKALPAGLRRKHNHRSPIYQSRLFRPSSYQEQRSA